MFKGQHDHGQCHGPCKNNQELTVKDFKKGDRVGYIAFDGSHDPGTVTSVNNKYVFVKFDFYSAQYRTSQACNPTHLRKN